MSTELKRTPLYETHKALGGKIVPFAGWELPVQYSGVIAEHQAVRQKAGLFDVSHMGEIFVTGPEAEAAINYLTCNDVASLYDGKAQYSAIINDDGGVVDDIIIYRYSNTRYLICVNASNTDKDFAWFTKRNKHNAVFENKSKDYGQIAIQGPEAVAIVEKFFGSREISKVQYFHFKEASVSGAEIIFARTGYTGEDGFELFIPAAHTVSVWNKLLELGKTHGLIPCGLGARDSLRLEACYPLHGHELGDDISAIESGLGWAVKCDKGDFIGRDVLKKHKESGSPRSLVGFYVDDPGIVREHVDVYSEGSEKIGITTSGTKTPTINHALGLALVASKFSKLDTPLFAEVRGKKLRCHVVKRPFYKRV